MKEFGKEKALHAFNYPSMIGLVTPARFNIASQKNDGCSEDYFSFRMANLQGELC